MGLLGTASCLGMLEFWSPECAGFLKLFDGMVPGIGDGPQTSVISLEPGSHLRSLPEDLTG